MELGFDLNCAKLMDDPSKCASVLDYFACRIQEEQEEDKILSREQITAAINVISYLRENGIKEISEVKTELDSFIQSASCGSTKPGTSLTNSPSK